MSRSLVFRLRNLLAVVSLLVDPAAGVASNLIAETPPTAPSLSRESQAENEVEHCYIGVVLASEAIDVVARTEGVILSYGAVVGEQVQRGQLLATLDSSAVRRQLETERVRLTAARIQQRRATLEAQQARDESERLGRIAELVAARDVEAARHAFELAQLHEEEAKTAVERAAAEVREVEAQLQRTRIRAPFAGRIAAQYSDTGALAALGSRLLRLVGSGARRVRFAVPPDSVDRIHLGSSVRVEPGSQAPTVEAVIHSIAPEIDPASEMVFVEATLQDLSAGQAIPLGTEVRISPALVAPSCW